MDFLDGIDSEGVEMDAGDLAREARVRAAYMDWIKDFNKESDETRFNQFYKNFLEMEDFSKETGKEMVLNEFADYTEEEYAAMQSGETVEVEKDTEAEAAAAKAEEEAATKAAAEKEAAEKEAAAKAAAEKEAASKAADDEAARKAEQEASKKAADEKREAFQAEQGKIFSAKKQYVQD